MLAKLVNIFSPYANRKNIIIGFALMIIINLFAFPWFGKKLKAIAPNSDDPIDLQFSYSPDKVYQMIESYSEKGRALYINSTLGIDIVYPIIYTITFILLLLSLFKKLYPNQKRIYIWALLPLIIFVADLLENTGIILMLKNFPERLDNVAKMGSVFTTTKWIFVMATILLALVLSFKKFRKKT